MADTKQTPDQLAADKIGDAIDGQILRLNEERAAIVAGPDRLAEIDATLAVLTSEKQKIDPRRPPKTVSPILTASTKKTP